MVIHHHELVEKVELIAAMPVDRPADLMAVNPLGKIPALVTDSGESVIDSPVICRYLDHLGTAAKLVPSAAEASIEVMRREALADGIMESAVAMVLESWRPKEFQWPGQFEKQTDNILRTLTVLEGEAEFLNAPLDLSHLATLAAVDYIHYRLAPIGVERDWLANKPRLSEWLERERTQAYAMETLPQGGW